MAKMWEVDPETRSKLLLIQKSNGNDRCCDCGAPSPQWASPKFSTFICLTCAGTHRGLGVHISFVRSISMDAFKTAEILRMEKGGNEPWKKFFDAHEANKMEGRTFEGSTVAERYSGEVGEEWKDRLTAKVEGTTYVKGEKKPTASTGSKPVSRSQTPVLQQRSQSPAKSAAIGAQPGKKEKNEAYFAKLGSQNASRPEDLPPNQGGKFSGFGSEPMPTRSDSAGVIPGVDDFQKDPVAALTKGFGWFTTAVGKGAKTVNDSYIQPAAKTITESEFTARAQATAAQMGQGIQTSAKGAADSFNRFVEGGDTRPGGGARGTAEPERKDFWDSFGKDDEALSTDKTKLSSIGTAAMKKGGGGHGGSGGKEEGDGWGDW